MGEIQSVHAHYPNAKRLDAAVWLLACKPGAVQFPIKGSMLMNLNGIRCTVDKPLIGTLLPDEGSAIFAERKAGPNGVVTVSDPSNFFQQHDGLVGQLVSLCAAKFETSRNQFSMTCASDGCTLLITTGTEGGGLAFMVKSPKGDALIVDDTPVTQLTAGCSDIKSFSFKLETETCEKDITVKRGRTEILREIAHYLNRTLVFCDINVQTWETRVYCLASNGYCELVKGRGGVKRFTKTPFNRFRVTPTTCVYAVDLPIDKFVYKTCIAEVLGVM